ncbi:MAG: hypothetical protein WC906_03465 [Parcubacteria group bacterium]|jgi:hypothetical protein
MKQLYERIVAFIDGLDKEMFRLDKAVRDTLAVWVIDDTNYKNVTLDGRVIPVNDFIPPFVTRHWKKATGDVIIGISYPLIGMKLPNC